MEIKRGEIYYADLGKPEKTQVQKGLRPVAIVSNNVGNFYSPTVIVAPLTSKIKKQELPTHTELTKDGLNGLEFNSMALLEQVTTIDKNNLKLKIGEICNDDMIKIDKCLKISLGLK